MAPAALLCKTLSDVGFGHIEMFRQNRIDFVKGYERAGADLRGLSYADLQRSSYITGNRFGQVVSATLDANLARTGDAALTLVHVGKIWNQLGADERDTASLVQSLTIFNLRDSAGLPPSLPRLKRDPHDLIILDEPLLLGALMLREKGSPLSLVPSTSDVTLERLADHLFHNQWPWSLDGKRRRVHRVRSADPYTQGFHDLNHYGDWRAHGEQNRKDSVFYYQTLRRILGGVSNEDEKEALDSCLAAMERTDPSGFHQEILGYLRTPLAALGISEARWLTELKSTFAGFPSEAHLLAAIETISTGEIADS